MMDFFLLNDLSMLASVSFCQQPPVIALLLVFPGVISPGHGKAPKSRLIPLVASAFKVDAKSTKALNHKGSLFWLPGVAQASPGKNCVSLWFFSFHSLLRPPSYQNQQAPKKTARLTHGLLFMGVKRKDHG